MRPPLILLVVVLVASASCTHDRPRPPADAPTTTTSLVPTTTTTTEPSPHFTDIPVALSPVSSSPTCAQAVRTGTLDALLSAFRAARVHGSGAEGCMTTQAVKWYCTDAKPCTDEQFTASPGPICLYSCRGYRVSDVSFAAERADDGAVTVSVGIEAVNAAGAPVSSEFGINESLTVGRGVPVGGTVQRPLVITDASTSA